MSNWYRVVSTGIGYRQEPPVVSRYPTLSRDTGTSVPEPDLEVVWSQAMFRRGEAPSLSSFPPVPEPPETP
jgi:hypothetical protein